MVLFRKNTHDFIFLETLTPIIIFHYLIIISCALIITFISAFLIVGIFFYTIIGMGCNTLLIFSLNNKINL